MKNTITVLSLVLLVSSVFAQWVTTPVDTAGTEHRGWWTAVEYRADIIHVGYIFWTSQSPLQTAIRYARSTDLGGTWAIETADSAANYGSSNALLGWFRGGLALDSAGRPHLAYTIEASVGTFCIHAWRNEAGTWLRETVEMRTSQPLICHDADIAIDSRDRPCIVYSHYGVMTRYAVRTDSGWIVNDIPAAGLPYGVAIALDSADNPHLAVGTLSNTNYCHSSDGGTTWSVENVASSWWQVDIALGRNGQPLIAYTETNSSIKFARRESPGNWLFRTLDPGGPNSCRPSICREPGTDSLHVAFYPTMGSTELKHALSTDNGTGWNVETVTTTGGVSASSSCPGMFAADGLWLIGTQIPGYKLGIAVQNMSAVVEQGAFGLSRITATPNPCRDFVRLSAPGMQSGFVSLYDRTGRIVARSAADGGTAVVDVRNLPAGVYLARADNSEAARARIVVAK